jgi:hypothetical protein
MLWLSSFVQSSTLMPMSRSVEAVADPLAQYLGQEVALEVVQVLQPCLAQRVLVAPVVR